MGEGTPAVEGSSTHTPCAVPTCVVIQASETHMGKQGPPSFRGISATSAGAQGLCMHLLTIPPGGRGKAHLHANHETAIYILHGEAEMWYGERLQLHLVVHAGDLLYIPAGMPHLPANRSDAEPCTAVVARTDPNEQESVLWLPALDRETVLCARHLGNDFHVRSE
jgi:uncharacterized RmlC-like cupin family protein